jgi:hypothetical protein
MLEARPTRDVSSPYEELLPCGVEVRYPHSATLDVEHAEIAQELDRETLRGGQTGDGHSMMPVRAGLALDKGQVA